MVLQEIVSQTSAPFSLLPRCVVQWACGQLSTDTLRDILCEGGKRGREGKANERKIGGRGCNKVLSKCLHCCLLLFFCRVQHEGSNLPPTGIMFILLLLFCGCAS